MIHLNAQANLRLRSRFLLCVFLLPAFWLTGCSNPDAMPEAMPDGYERVDRGFGLRTKGVEEKNGLVFVPVAEFRSDGGYALYPMTTNCDGEFDRDMGTVFDETGAIQEQIPAISGGGLETYPQYKSVLAQACRIAYPPPPPVVQAPKPLAPQQQYVMDPSLGDPPLEEHEEEARLEREVIVSEEEWDDGLPDGVEIFPPSLKFIDPIIVLNSDQSRSGAHNQNIPDLNQDLGYPASLGLISPEHVLKADASR